MNLTPKEHAWLVAAGKDSFAKVGSSAYFMSLMTPSYTHDPLCALELGYAILQNKPMFFAVEEGVSVPEVLRRLAVKIVFYKKDDKADFERAMTEITDLLKADLR